MMSWNPPVFWDARRITNLFEQLARIETKLDQLRVLDRGIRRDIRREGVIEMATQEEIARLTATVAANTDRVSSAVAALNGFVQSTADLTQQLRDALAAANISDPAVVAAADALDANNAALAAAVPAMGEAVAANT